jgi:hypothetical protein
MYVATINQFNPDLSTKSTILTTTTIVGTLSIFGKLFLEEKDTIYNIHVEGLEMNKAHGRRLFNLPHLTRPINTNQTIIGKVDENKIDNFVAQELFKVDKRIRKGG